MRCGNETELVSMGIGVWPQSIFRRSFKKGRPMSTQLQPKNIRRAPFFSRILSQINVFAVYSKIMLVNVTAEPVSGVNA